MQYILDIYKELFFSLKRGNTKGVFSNAKPIFLLSIFDSINFNTTNEIRWGNKELIYKYSQLNQQYNILKPTLLWKPFYYLSSEPFYTLVWKETPPEELLKRPSGKLLKDYLDYAKLDDELWTLLQDADNREYLRNCIINQYLS